MKLTPQDHATAVAAVASYQLHIYDWTLNHSREFLPTSVEAMSELAEYLELIKPPRGSRADLGTHMSAQLVPALLWFGRNAAEAALALLTDPPATISAVDALDAYHASIAALVAPYNTMVRP